MNIEIIFKDFNSLVELAEKENKHLHFGMTKDHNKYITKLVAYFILALGFSIILNIYVSYFQG